MDDKRRLQKWEKTCLLREEAAAAYIKAHAEEAEAEERWRKTLHARVAAVREEVSESSRVLTQQNAALAETVDALAHQNAEMMGMLREMRQQPRSSAFQ
jgi:hypothetical protein